jgi:SAM-dependent methyltransferase
MANNRMDENRGENRESVPSSRAHSGPPRQTTRSHAWIRPALALGPPVLDLTAGTGQDTLFLRREAPPAVAVLALDRQPEALARTAARLASHGLRARLLAGDHQEVGTLLQRQEIPTLAAALANLGYLPGGNRAIVTTPAGTLAALRAVAARLAPGGRLAVVAYTGHPGGPEEAAAVRAWWEELPRADWDTELDPADLPAGRPVFFGAVRRGPEERP